MYSFSWRAVVSQWSSIEQWMVCLSEKRLSLFFFLPLLLSSKKAWNTFLLFEWIFYKRCFVCKKNNHHTCGGFFLLWFGQIGEDLDAFLSKAGGQLLECSLEEETRNILIDCHPVLNCPMLGTPWEHLKGNTVTTEIFCVESDRFLAAKRGQTQRA